jgi:hypothetical protein
MNRLDRTIKALEGIRDEPELATAEQIVTALDLVDMLKEAVDALGEQAEAAAIRYINANGDIEVGTVRYYVGTTRTTKVVDAAATCAELLDRVGGDFKEFTATLVAQPFKPNAARTVLGDSYNRFFHTKTVDDLMTGKPKRSLKRSDTRFERATAQPGPAPVPRGTE